MKEHRHIGASVAILLALASCMPPAVLAEENSTAPKVVETPAEYIDSAFSLLKENHINRALIDWDSLRQAASLLTVNAKETKDTYPALRAVLAALGEKHSHLVPPRLPQTAPAKSGAAIPDAPMPTGNAEPGDVGYVSLPRLVTIGGREADGERYHDKLKEMLVSLDHGARCGWIIDLRDNLGGDMWPMLDGLDPLLGQGPLGYFIMAEGNLAWVRTEDGMSPEDIGSMPDKAPAFALNNASAPLAILLGPKTVSTGEMIAIALAGRERTKTFGSATGDLATAVTPIELSDGAFLGITTSKVAYRDGSVVEGPIRPAVETDDPKAAAMAWLASSCPAQ